MALDPGGFNFFSKLSHATKQRCNAVLEQISATARRHHYYNYYY